MDLKNEEATQVNNIDCGKIDVFGSPNILRKSRSKKELNLIEDLGQALNEIAAEEEILDNAIIDLQAYLNTKCKLNWYINNEEAYYVEAVYDYDARKIIKVYITLDENTNSIYYTINNSNEKIDSLEDLKIKLLNIIEKLDTGKITY